MLHDWRTLPPCVIRAQVDTAHRRKPAASSPLRKVSFIKVCIGRPNVWFAVDWEALPKRWVVERTFAWISRNRRLARDFERYARTVAAFCRLAMIRLMLRRLTRPSRST